jgi:alanine racemase
VPGAATRPEAARGARAGRGIGPLSARPAAPAADQAPLRARARIVATRLPLIEAAPGGPLPPLPRSAWIEIDLDALVSNARLLQSSLPPGVRLEAVVKGDAYGHGAVAVARALVAAGIQSLSVATFDEGLELRQAGISVPILVLFPIPPEFVPDAMCLRLSVTAGDQTLLERSLAVLDRLAGAGAGGAAVAADRELPIHLEVETGLGRGGLHSSDVPAAAAAIEAAPRARLAGVWSHLQAPGDPGRTADQAARLGVASSLLEKVGITMPDRHLAASGGLLAASAPGYDVVRVGLAVYGIVPDGLAVDERQAATAAGLEPILSLRARPVRVTELPAGTGVSYGPTFVTSRPSRIATLPLGYADGLPRSLSNKAQVLVRGGRVPAVGTVAMDAVMVDVTDVPGAPVSVDDEFTLIGTQGDETIDAIEMARWGNTISYEIVTAMSGRLPRVYYAAARAVQMRAVACDLDRGGGEVDRTDAPASEEDPGPLGCE